jgi:hypothetical protein
VVDQTLSNWVRAHRAGTLKEVNGKARVTAEQMEVIRLRAELAWVTMERDILEKGMAYFAKGQNRSMPLMNVIGISGRSVCSAGYCGWAYPAFIKTLPGEGRSPGAAPLALVAALALLLDRALEKTLHAAGSQLSTPFAWQALETIRSVQVELGQQSCITRGNKHAAEVLRLLGLLNSIHPPPENQECLV